MSANKQERIKLQNPEKSEVKSQREPISSLYVLKALCAIGVVSLHAPFGIATDYIRLISSVTVITFFMITGYFLQTDDVSKFLQRAWKSIKKIIPIILLLNLMFVPLAPINGNFSETYMLYFKWLVLGQTNGFAHLWYLTALVQALIVMYLLVYFFKDKGLALLKFLALLWLVHIINGEYKELLFGKPQSFLNSNFLTYALPSISFGLILRKYETKLLANKNW